MVDKLKYPTVVRLVLIDHSTVLHCHHSANYQFT